MAVDCLNTLLIDCSTGYLIGCLTFWLLLNSCLADCRADWSIFLLYSSLESKLRGNVISGTV